MCQLLQRGILPDRRFQICNSCQYEIINFFLKILLHTVRFRQCIVDIHFLPFVNRFAPFNNNRLQTGFGQSKPGKHSCRPTADHQRTNISRLLFPNHQNRLFLYQFNIFPGQNRRNIIFVTPDFHIQGIYEMHIPLIAGINRFLGNFNTLDIFGIQPGFD